jgi:hypothetical protein
VSTDGTVGVSTTVRKPTPGTGLVVAVGLLTRRDSPEARGRPRATRWAQHDRRMGTLAVLLCRVVHATAGWGRDAQNGRQVHTLHAAQGGRETVGSRRSTPQRGHALRRPRSGRSLLPACTVGQQLALYAGTHQCAYRASCLTNAPTLRDRRPSRCTRTDAFLPYSAAMSILLDLSSRAEQLSDHEIRDSGACA